MAIAVSLVGGFWGGIYAIQSQLNLGIVITGVCFVALTPLLSILPQLDVVVSQVRPISYIVVYLAAIPVFGALYTLIAAHGFYAPYAQFEPAAELDMWEVRHLLENSFQNSIRSHRKDELVIGDTTFLDIVGIRDLKVTNDKKLSFQLFIAGTRPGDTEWNHNGGLFGRVIVGEELGVVGGPKVDRAIEPPTEIGGGPELTNEQKQSAFRLALWHSEARAGEYSLLLSGDEASEVTNYILGVNGDPSDLSDSYYRMTYLSAVVITTLGLGDIVPISWPGKVLVAFEALFGIVVAGLFLNSLAYRASRTQSCSPERDP